MIFDAYTKLVDDTELDRMHKHHIPLMRKARKIWDAMVDVVGPIPTGALV